MLVAIKYDEFGTVSFLGTEIRYTLKTRIILSERRGDVAIKFYDFSNSGHKLSFANIQFMVFEIAFQNSAPSLLTALNAGMNLVINVFSLSLVSIVWSFMSNIPLLTACRLARLVVNDRRFAKLIQVGQRERQSIARQQEEPHLSKFIRNVS